MTDTSLQGSLYETDIVTWAERQVAELRRVAASAPGNAVDWANVIEQIECVGRSEWKGVRSQLANALAHILKGHCDPNSLSSVAWMVEVTRFLAEARDDYRPSMRQMIDMDRVWIEGFRHASDSLQPYGISIPPGIPAKCPFTIDEMLDETFTYDGALRRLHAVVETLKETPR